MYIHTHTHTLIHRYMCVCLYNIVYVCSKNAVLYLIFKINPDLPTSETATGRNTNIINWFLSRSNSANSFLAQNPHPEFTESEKKYYSKTLILSNIFFRIFCNKYSIVSLVIWRFVIINN